MRHLKLVHWLLLGIVFVAVPAGANAQVAVGVAVHIGPPALPVYVQPVCPAPGYIWTPGYWAYGPAGYFWVPGTWVLAPEPGLLWTPGYWGYGPGGYFWHAGYWGPHVGFYGGINYGFGYTGVGFVGGYWSGRNFYYNRSVTAVNVTVVHNTYTREVVVNNTAASRVSYNGGTGGITARPTSAEVAAGRERHVSATSVQTQHFEAARGNPALRESANHGNPSVAATKTAGVFSGPGVTAARRENANASAANGGKGQPAAQTGQQGSFKNGGQSGSAAANSNAGAHPQDSNAAGAGGQGKSAGGGGHTEGKQQHQGKSGEGRERGGERGGGKPPR
ncbi:MAG TPA: YXWGXW repeat-containing protein [Candidatus Binatia bacterium]|nr:YXWGXW repeat-containing protein [Candidatus Binatia bacterium]